ncbi:hypothetical protein [Actinoplanes sp. NPDC051494]|uniref:hypothetical protein n=1 Tax=Actinoplanes sp. NPDC051494 TaxID=3363907 RepID=UPI0037B5F9E9
MVTQITQGNPALFDRAVLQVTGEAAGAARFSRTPGALICGTSITSRSRHPNGTAASAAACSPRS